MSSIKLEDFKLLKIIGYGVNSTVFAAELNNNIYAIKAATKERARITDFGVTEKDVLKKIHHPFIVNMLGCFTTANHLCYALEYAPGGDMLYYLESNGWKIPEESVAFYGSEIALAISKLHSLCIIHRDVKLRNILIAIDGHVKLTDFGSALDVHHEGRKNSLHGTTMYMAPEVLKTALYSYEVDWWSLGICIYIMLYGITPFNASGVSYSYKNLIEFVTQGNITFQNTISKPATSLLKRFLHSDPAKRLGKAGFDEVRVHEFFVNINWRKLEAKEIKPPFIPELRNATDFHYFDPDRVKEACSLTENPSPSCEQKIGFEDFDYINPDWKY